MESFQNKLVGKMFNVCSINLSIKLFFVFVKASPNIAPKTFHPKTNAVPAKAKMKSIFNLVR